MGIRCHAYLVFGFDLGEDGFEQTEEELEVGYVLEEVLEARLEKLMPLQEGQSSWDDAKCPWPVKLEHYGHYDNAAYVFCLRAPTMRGDWEAPTEAEPRLLTDLDVVAARATIQEWCEKLRIPFKEPKWLLLGYMS